MSLISTVVTYRGLYLEDVMTVTKRRFPLRAHLAEFGMVRLRPSGCAFLAAASIRSNMAFESEKRSAPTERWVRSRRNAGSMVATWKGDILEDRPVLRL